MPGLLRIASLWRFGAVHAFHEGMLMAPLFFFSPRTVGAGSSTLTRSLLAQLMPPPPTSPFDVAEPSAEVTAGGGGGGGGGAAPVSSSAPSR